MPTELRVVGTVEASAIVQVKSQIAGELLQRRFTEGQNVAKGDLLFQIDPAPLRGRPAAGRSQRGARPRPDRPGRKPPWRAMPPRPSSTQSDAERYAELPKQEGLASKSQSDQSSTSADVARESARATQASIESAKAALDADEAAVAAAKLNLNYCQIRAPISGRTGNLLVHAGNLVKVNDVPLVVIHQVAPIFVNFSVPEQHLAAIRRLNAPTEARRARLRRRTIPTARRPVALSVIDNTVDTTTGTIHLKATFDNQRRACCGPASSSPRC